MIQMSHELSIQVYSNPQITSWFKKAYNIMSQVPDQTSHK